LESKESGLIQPMLDEFINEGQNEQ